MLQDSAFPSPCLIFVSLSQSNACIADVTSLKHLLCGSAGRARTASASHFTDNLESLPSRPWQLPAHLKHLTNTHILFHPARGLGHPHPSLGSLFALSAHFQPSQARSARAQRAEKHQGSRHPAADALRGYRFVLVSSQLTVLASCLTLV